MLYSRITQRQSSRNYTYNMTRIGDSMNKVFNALIRETKFGNASENPMNAAKYTNVHGYMNRTYTYDANLNTAKGILGTAESQLTQHVVSQLGGTSSGESNTLIAYMLSGYNDGKTQADRNNIAAALDEMGKTIIASLNIDFGGRQLFGGTSNIKPAFSFDETSRTVYYNGVSVKQPVTTVSPDLSTGKPYPGYAEFYTRADLQFDPDTGANLKYYKVDSPPQYVQNTAGDWIQQPAVSGSTELAIGKIAAGAGVSLDTFIGTPTNPGIKDDPAVRNYFASGAIKIDADGYVTFDRRLTNPLETVEDLSSALQGVVDAAGGKVEEFQTVYDTSRYIAELDKDGNIKKGADKKPIFKLQDENISGTDNSGNYVDAEGNVLYLNNGDNTYTKVTDGTALMSPSTVAGKIRDGEIIRQWDPFTMEVTYTTPDGEELLIQKPQGQFLESEIVTVVDKDGNEYDYADLKASMDRSNLHLDGNTGKFYNQAEWNAWQATGFNPVDAPEAEFTCFEMKKTPTLMGGKLELDGAGDPIKIPNVDMYAHPAKMTTATQSYIVDGDALLNNKIYMQTGTPDGNTVDTTRKVPLMDENGKILLDDNGQVRWKMNDTNIDGQDANGNLTDKDGKILYQCTIGANDEKKYYKVNSWDGDGNPDNVDTTDTDPFAHPLKLQAGTEKRLKDPNTCEKEYTYTYNGEELSAEEFEKYGYKRFPGSTPIYIDVGLGFAYNAKGEVDSQTAIDISVNGIQLTGWGTDENGYSNNIIQLVFDAADALRKNDRAQLSELINNYSDSFENFSAYKNAVIGTRQGQIEALIDKNKLDQQNYATAEEDAKIMTLQDFAAYSTKWSSMQMIYNAALQMGSQVIPNSIFNYIS